MFRKTLVAALFLIGMASTKIKAQEFINTKIDVIAGSGSFMMNTVIYKPANFSTSKKYPLVLFFHGMGEAGTDINKMYKSGLPKVLKDGYKPSFEFIMVAVQHNSYSLDPKHLNQVTDEAIRLYPNIDLTRIYLTGLSAGGNTIYVSSLNIDQQLPKRFAAMVVMSGATQGINKNNFAWWKDFKTPLWAVVGGNDPSYKGQNEYVVNEVNKQVPGLASLTVRSGVGHGGWNDVYNGTVKTTDGKTMWQWLYQFTRGGSSTPTPTPPTPPTNQSPVANAGSNKTITLPTNSVAISGSATDADGSIASYTWSKVAGPSQFTISNTSVANPTISNLVAGTYTFRLTARDNSGATDTDDVNVVVNSGSGSTTPPSTGGERRILVDLGATSTGTDSWGKVWNNVSNTRPGTPLSNAKTTTNQATTIGLQVVNRIDGTFSTSGAGVNGGTTTGTVSEYPSSSTSDYAFAHNTASNGKWRIFGLDPSKTYTIKFWGTKSSSANYTIQIKRADQTAWQEYNASGNRNYNTASTFTFSGSAEMTFDIRTKSGSTFGYISVIDIVEN